MKLLVVYLVFVAVISVAKGQDRYPTKQGACPPALPVQFCGHSCFVDSHCTGIGKCCPTQCGGSICTMPVTMTRSSQSGEKSFAGALRQMTRSETIMITHSRLIFNRRKWKLGEEYAHVLSGLSEKNIFNLFSNCEKWYFH